MVIVFNINKMVVVFNINIKLATVLIRIWKGLRQPADLVGGTRMGTSCHLAYLLHIFTIAGIIIININIVTITIVTIDTMTIFSIVNVSLTFSVLRFLLSVLL